MKWENSGKVKFFPSLLFFFILFFALLFRYFYSPVSFFPFLIILPLLLAVFVKKDVSKMFFLIISLFWTFYFYVSFFNGINFHTELNFSTYFVKKVAYFSDSTNYLLLKSLLFGKKNSLDICTKTLFKNSGSFYLIAVSGLHFGIVAFIFNFIFSFLQKRVRNLFIIVILFIYLVMVDFYISAFRAFLMIMLYLLGKTFGIKTYSLNILFSTAFLMLLLNPNYFNRISFWLSFLATAGIIFFLNFFDIRNKILSWFLISVSAQLFIFPIIIFYFGKINLLSPFLNLFAFLFLYPIIFIGFLLLLPFPEQITLILVKVVEFFIKFFKEYISVFNNNLFICKFEISKIGFVIYYFALLFFLLFFQRYHRKLLNKRV